MIGLVPWWLWLLAGAAALRVWQWLFETVSDPIETPAAPPQPQRAVLVTVLTRATHDQPADIAPAIKVGRGEGWWN